MRRSLILLSFLIIGSHLLSSCAPKEFNGYQKKPPRNVVWKQNNPAAQPASKNKKK